MNVVCDADGLIKLQRAGLLETLARHAQLIVGDEVWREAVTVAKARGFPDAFEIEHLEGRFRRLPGREQLPPASPPGSVGLGAGEREAAELYFSEAADAILSDDRRFLSALEAEGIPYVTPAAMVVVMAEWRLLTASEASTALERLQPIIRRSQIEAARQDLREIERNTP